MFESVDGFGEEVGSILHSRDVRSANGFGANKISNEVPSNVNMLGSIVEHGVVR